MPGMYASSRVSVYMVNLVEDLAFMAPGKSWPKMSRQCFIQTWIKHKDFDSKYLPSKFLVHMRLHKFPWETADN